MPSEPATTTAAVESAPAGEAANPESPGKTQFNSGVVSLVSTLIGIGLLAVPYAVSKAGLVWGILLTLLAAVTSAIGLQYMAFTAACVPPGRATFYYVSQRTVPELSIVFDFALAIKCFGMLAAYLIVIGDLVPKIAKSVFPHSWIAEYAFLTARHFWTALFTLFLALFSFKKQLTTLRNFAIASLASAGYVVVLVIVHFYHVTTGGKDKVPPGKINIHTPGSWLSVVTTFPILVLAFTCHQSEFAVINGQSDRSLPELRKINLTVILTGFIIYLIVGICGYLSFGNKVSSDVLKMYPSGFFVTLGRLIIVILVSIDFPLELEPTRTTINHIYCRLAGPAAPSMPSDNADSSHANVASSAHATETTPLAADFPSTTTPDDCTVVDDMHVVNKEIEDCTHDPAEHEITNTRFYVITVLLLLLAWLISYYASSLGKILSLIGMTSGASLSYILPGYFAYEMAGNLPGAPNSQSKSTRRGAAILAIWGALVLVLCVTGAVIQAAAKWGE